MELGLTRKLLDEVMGELVFYQTLIHVLPVVVYTYEIERKEEVKSVRNIWMNQRGLDFMGYSQDEISRMGYDFFRETIHPDDLEVIPQKLSKAFRDKPVFIGMHRIKAKNQSKYCWTYCHGIVLKTFDDGSPRKLLTVAFEITETLHTENQLAIAMKEINSLKQELKRCCLTQREKEVLHLIVKGKTDKEISHELFISVTTAKKHRTNLIRKVGVHNSVELWRWLWKTGNIDFIPQLSSF